MTDTAIPVIVKHLKILSADLKERFSDERTILKHIDFSTRMMQRMLVVLSDISNMLSVSRKTRRNAK